MKTVSEMTIDERLTYSDAIHALSPAQCWAAWENGELTVYHMFEYQARHGITFNENGEITNEKTGFLDIPLF